MALLNVLDIQNGAHLKANLIERAMSRRMYLWHQTIVLAVWLDLWTTIWCLGTIISEAQAVNKRYGYNFFIEYDGDIYPQELSLAKYGWGADAADDG